MPPDHLGDAHLRVVNHHGKLIGKDAVAAADEEVTAVTGEDLGLRAKDTVGKGDGARGVIRAGNHKAERRGAHSGASRDLLGGEASAGARVDGRAVARVGRARGVELGACAEARVEQSRVAELLEGGLIRLNTVALVVGSLVPIEAKPVKISEQAVCPRPRLGARVEVLYAQHHAPAGTADR